jgi:hypothetical protein
MKSTIIWDVTLGCLVEIHHVSEEHTASTFRVNEYNKQQVEHYFAPENGGSTFL